MLLGIAEAMSCGLPAIGFDVLGVREQIKQNETGVLLPYDAAVEEIAAKMESCVEHKDVMGKKAAIQSEIYHTEKACKRIIVNIDENIARRGEK